MLKIHTCFCVALCEFGRFLLAFSFLRQQSYPIFLYCGLHHTDSTSCIRKYAIQPVDGLLADKELTILKNMEYIYLNEYIISVIYRVQYICSLSHIEW